jgi:hypothetical protein
LQLGGIVPSLASSEIGPLPTPWKFRAERIGTIAKREMSAYFGVL